MSEHWKSTPSYWCKFCSTYVRDTGIERKNHDASAKHQNNIQRNLRELQKGKAKEDRDKQRAKDEIARLNGLVGGSKAALSPSEGASGAASKGKPVTAPPKLSASAQRKAHAEQLIALGIELPEELKGEVTGVGGWQTLSERVVEEDVKPEEDSKDDVKGAISRGVHKRKAEDGDEEEAEASRRKAWGSRLKTYPGVTNGTDTDEGDLDALLSGVGGKKATEVKKEESKDMPAFKDEDAGEERLLSAVPDVDAPIAPVKQEDPAEEHSAPPTVVFKKRKVKK